MYADGERRHSNWKNLHQLFTADVEDEEDSFRNLLGLNELFPVGLSRQRQKYLYESIRPYTRDYAKDILCPKPKSEPEPEPAPKAKAKKNNKQAGDVLPSEPKPKPKRKNKQAGDVLPSKPKPKPKQKNKQAREVLSSEPEPKRKRGRPRKDENNKE